MTRGTRWREPTAFRLMTRLFVRRLVDNDLISPHADPHDSLALVMRTSCPWACSGPSSSRFRSLAALVQLRARRPGRVVRPLLFIAASIVDQRAGRAPHVGRAGARGARRAILGPLPIRRAPSPGRSSRRRSVFGAVLTIALNAVPSVLYPAFLTVNIRGTRGVTILGLIASHATTVTMAGMFGFFGILAIPGCSASRRRTGVPAGLEPVQTTLVVSMVTALLLALTVRASDVRRWVAATQVRRTRPPCTLVSGGERNTRRTSGGRNADRDAAALASAAVPRRGTRRLERKIARPSTTRNAGAMGLDVVPTRDRARAGDIPLDQPPASRSVRRRARPVARAHHRPPHCERHT